MADVFLCVVPELPLDIPGQTNMVEMLKYLVDVGKEIKAKKPFAVVRAGETLLSISLTVDATVKKLFIKPGEAVRVGNPIAALLTEEKSGDGKKKEKLPRTRSKIMILKKKIESVD